MKKITLLVCFVVTVNLIFANDHIPSNFSYSPSFPICPIKPSVAFPLPKFSYSHFSRIHSFKPPSLCQLVMIHLDSVDLYEQYVDSAIGSLTEQEQQAFFDDLDAHGAAQAASDYKLSEELVDSIVSKFHGVGSSLISIVYRLFGSVDSIRSSNWSVIADSVLSCFWKATVPYAKIINPGPCEDAYDDCLDSAHDNYVDALFWCYLGGLSLSAISGGLGLGLGVSCISFQYYKYGKAKKRCKHTYED